MHLEFNSRNAYVLMLCLLAAGLGTLSRAHGESLRYRSENMDVKRDKDRHPALDVFLQQTGFYKIQLDSGSHHEQLTGYGVFCGEGQRFLVDSGCSISRVNDSMTRKLKSLGELNTEIQDPVLGQVQRADVVLLDKVELDKAVFMNQPALPLDLAMAGRRSDFKIVLGWDFFRRNNCIIDCYGGRLYVRSAPPTAEQQAALEDTLREAGYQAVPLVSDASLVYHCDVVAEGKPFKLMIDTGAEHVAIDDGFAKELKMDLAATSSRSVGFADVGEHFIDIGKIPRLQMGDVTFTNFGVNVMAMEYWNIGEKSANNIQGVLGMTFLYPSQALIDFGHDKMWIMPVQPKPIGGQAILSPTPFPPENDGRLLASQFPPAVSPTTGLSLEFPQVQPSNGRNW